MTLATGFGPDAAAIDITYFPTPDSDEDWFLAGPLRADPIWLQPVAHVPVNAYGFSTWGDPGVDGRSLVLSGGGSVFRTDPTTLGLTRTASRLTFGDAVCCGRALGAATLFDTETPPPGTWLAQDGGAPALRFRPPTGTDASVLYNDGVSFFWFEGHGVQPDDSFTAVDLWTAPRATAPAGVVPRRISGTGLTFIPAEVTVGNGRVGLNPESAGDGYRVVNPDGTWWSIAPDAGAYFSKALYLVPTEIPLQTARLGDTEPSGIQRLRFDALGPSRAAAP